MMSERLKRWRQLAWKICKILGLRAADALATYLVFYVIARFWSLLPSVFEQYRREEWGSVLGACLAVALFSLKAMPWPILKKLYAYFELAFGWKAMTWALTVGDGRGVAPFFGAIFVLVRGIQNLLDAAAAEQALLAKPSNTA